MDNDKIIERGTQSLSFVEQLQNQIQLCREGLSGRAKADTDRVAGHGISGDVRPLATGRPSGEGRDRGDRDAYRPWA